MATTTKNQTRREDKRVEYLPDTPMSIAHSQDRLHQLGNGNRQFVSDKIKRSSWSNTFINKIKVPLISNTFDYILRRAVTIPSILYSRIDLPLFHRKQKPDSILTETKSNMRKDTANLWSGKAFYSTNLSPSEDKKAGQLFNKIDDSYPAISPKPLLTSTPGTRKADIYNGLNTSNNIINSPSTTINMSLANINRLDVTDNSITPYNVSETNSAFEVTAERNILPNNVKPIPGQPATSDKSFQHTYVNRMPSSPISLLTKRIFQQRELLEKIRSNSHITASTDILLRDKLSTPSTNQFNKLTVKTVGQTSSTAKSKANNLNTQLLKVPRLERVESSYKDSGQHIFDSHRLVERDSTDVSTSEFKSAQTPEQNNTSTVQKSSPKPNQSSRPLYRFKTPEENNLSKEITILHQEKLPVLEKAHPTFRQSETDPAILSKRDSINIAQQFPRNISQSSWPLSRFRTPEENNLSKEITILHQEKLPVLEKAHPIFRQSETDPAILSKRDSINIAQQFPRNISQSSWPLSRFRTPEENNLSKEMVVHYQDILSIPAEKQRSISLKLKTQSASDLKRNNIPPAKYSFQKPLSSSKLPLPAVLNDKHFPKPLAPHEKEGVISQQVEPELKTTRGQQLLRKSGTDKSIEVPVHGYKAMAQDSIEKNPISYRSEEVITTHEFVDTNPIDRHKSNTKYNTKIHIGDKSVTKIQPKAINNISRIALDPQRISGSINYIYKSKMYEVGALTPDVESILSSSLYRYNKPQTPDLPMVSLSRSKEDSEDTLNEKSLNHSNKIPELQRSLSYYSQDTASKPVQRIDVSSQHQMNISQQQFEKKNDQRTQDIKIIAEKVYSILKQELKIERERDRHRLLR